MYRKGIDLLIAAIPRLCAAHPDLHFLIGGDGPKRVELEQMRERFLLQDRVELCGAVRQGDVKPTSPAARSSSTRVSQRHSERVSSKPPAAALFVVSTRVGGVPEVLPPEMIRLARPEEDDVVRAMDEAISYVRAGKHDPRKYHEAVKKMYSGATWRRGWSGCTRMRWRESFRGQREVEEVLRGGCGGGQDLCDYRGGRYAVSQVAAVVAAGEGGG